MKRSGIDFPHFCQCLQYPSPTYIFVHFYHYQGRLSPPLPPLLSFPGSLELAELWAKPSLQSPSEVSLPPFLLLLPMSKKQPWGLPGGLSGLLTALMISPPTINYMLPLQHHCCCPVGWWYLSHGAKGLGQTVLEGMGWDKGMGVEGQGAIGDGKLPREGQQRWKGSYEIGWDG